MSILSIAVVPFAASVHVRAAGGDYVTTTIYVGRHFEVRDHDQPVKYVFQGDTRAARITGSLSDNARIQRWRLQAGWNLCGVALDGARFPTNAAIASVYQWNRATQDYSTVEPGQRLSAGSVLWVKAGTHAVASLVGNHIESKAVTIGAGGTCLATGLEGWPLPMPAGVTVWRYDAASARWCPTFANELAPSSAVLPQLAPGEAIYLHAEEPVELGVPDPALHVAYYHQDHLGSSSVVTDASGALAEETAYYPFGAVRREARLRAVEAHYQFTQKERDRESGLQNFGHRYYHAAGARWLNPDPLGERGGGSNPYAYVNQNPLKHYDPDGAEIKVKVDNEKKPTKYEITLKAVFINASSTKFSQQQLTQFATKLKSRIEDSFKKEKGAVTWSTRVDLRVVNGWSEVGKDDHVFRIVDKQNGAGETIPGGMLMSIKSHRFTQKHPSEVDQTLPGNKHYTLENYTSAEGTATHEFGHAAGLHHDDLHENLMQNGDIRKFDNTHVTQEQIHAIWKAYKAGSLNQRESDLKALTKSN